jgi:hypothetical protein
VQASVASRNDEVRPMRTASTATRVESAPLHDGKLGAIATIAYNRRQKPPADVLPCFSKRACG